MIPVCRDEPGSLQNRAMNTTVGEAVGSYVATRRWAHGTTKHSTYTLGQFAEVVGVDRLVRDLDHDDAERWWATRQHLAASSARSRRSTVANFLRWCRHVGLLDGDPLAGIPVPREPRRMPATLSDEDVAALRHVLPDYRAEAIVELMLRLGLRCVDVSQLQRAGTSTYSRSRKRARSRSRSTLPATLRPPVHSSGRTPARRGRCRRSASRRWSGRGCVTPT
jgi:site-specific recombinase XerD